jgi:pimeloyl-ACP methyl ester carboxylesterase
MKRSITGNVECNLSGIPVLILGPASIYIPTIPDSLKTQFFFYGADYYWTYHEKISSTIISSLTIKHMIHDGERIRSAFEKKGYPVSKTIVLGASLLGWLALKQATLFSNTVLGVIGLNTPVIQLETLIKEQQLFIKPYNPSLFPKLATKQSRQLWENYQKFSFEYDKQKKLGFPTDTDDYIAELQREKIRYMEDDMLFRKTLQSWKHFNITTRKKFFENVNKIQPETFKNLTCPVLLTLGSRDGIVPPYTVSEGTMHQLPKNFDYYIFDAKHMPQLEDAENFGNKFTDWVDKNDIVPNNRIGLSKL